MLMLKTGIQYFPDDSIQTSVQECEVAAAQPRPLTSTVSVVDRFTQLHYIIYTFLAKAPFS